MEDVLLFFCICTSVKPKGCTSCQINAETDIGYNSFQENTDAFTENFQV